MAGDATKMASKYAKRLDLAFKKKSFTDKYVNHDYDFDGVNTISVYGLTTQALTDYTLGSPTAYGTPDTTDSVVTSYTLSNHKKYNKFFDNFVVSKQNGVDMVAQWVKNQINQIVVPAVDTERITTAVAAAVANGHSVPFVAGTVLHDMRTEAGRMFDLGVYTGIVSFVDSVGLIGLKESVQGFISYTSSEVISERQFRGNIDGVDVIEVPTGYFPNANTHMVMWHPDAVLGTREWAKHRIIDTEGGDGKLAQGHIAYQTFVMNAKKDAISAFIAEAA